jgi:hypothetical protein
MKRYILFFIVFGSQFNFAQSVFPIDGGNVGIGTNSPSSSLHIKTPKGDLLVENSGIEGASMIVNSGRHNRPALTTYKQVGTEYWNAGILYDEAGNQKYSIGTTFEFSSSKLTIQSNGNVGIGVTNPQTKFQIGEFNNIGNYKVSIPGVYNFEEVRLGQYGNGASGLEMITHSNQTYSFGVRLFANVDTGGQGLLFQTANPTLSAQDLNYVTRMAISINGNVGIGTINPDSKLTVNGTIHSTEVKVDLNIPAPDYVFETNYKLKSLQEVETYVKENSHLPEIPSAKEFEKNGIQLAEMNMALLKKIEELTLYIIQMKKKKKQSQTRLEKVETK